MRCKAQRTLPILVRLEWSFGADLWGGAHEAGTWSIHHR